MLAELRAAVGRLFTATDGRDVLQNTPDGWEIDRPWLWWDGPADSSDGTGGPWGNPLPGADHPWARSGIPAMARCRALICDVLAGVPWKVYRGREQLPTPSWIADPQGLNNDARRMSSVANVSLSAVEFWSQALVSAVELGEAVLYSPFVGEIDPTTGLTIQWGSRGLFALNPLDVKREKGEWVINGEIVPDADLLFIRNRVWPGKTRGLGVWQQFGAEIGFAESVRDYGAGLLGRGIPSGYLKVTAPDLEQGEAEKLKDRWMAAHGGSRRRIAVLNATTDFKPLEINPEAVQLAELLKLTAWEVALIYGVPPYKLGVSMGYNNTYANIESASIDYVQDALLPWARRIESAIDSRLPHGTTLKLDLDGLQRADTAARFNAYAIGLEHEFITREEVRTLEDLPPLVTQPQLTAVTTPEEEAAS